MTNQVKKSREWKGQSPGVRIESGHLKNRLPAVRRGRHFPQAGNRAFSQVVRLFFVAAHRLPFRKAITSENCGFVLSTKPQFSKGLRSKTGVQQHPKNTQQRLFRQTESPAGNFHSSRASFLFNFSHGFDSLPAAAFLLQPGNQPDHHKPGRQHERAGEPAPSRRDPGEDLGHRR